MKKLLSVFLAMVMALSVVMVGNIFAFAGTVYESENNDDYDKANTLALDNTIYGRLQVKYDDDYFKFVLPSDGKVSITFTNEMAECDDYFHFDIEQYAGANKYKHILRSEINGDKYIYCRDRSSYTTATTGLPKGTYYIRVTGYSEMHLQYGVKVNFTATTNWETEYNEDYDTADPLTLGTTRYGTLVKKYVYNSETYSADDDYYKFVLPADGKVDIKFTNGMAECDDYFIVDIYQYAGSNSYDHVARSQINGGKYIYCRDRKGYTFPSLGLPKGTYYIDVFGYSEKHLTYGINVSFTESTAWESEFNEGFDTADPIALGKTMNGTLVKKFMYSSENYASDDDCYKFTIDSSDIYNIRFKYNKKETDGYFRFYLYKYTGSGGYTKIYESNYLNIRDGSSYNTGIMILDKGTYYIDVFGTFDSQNDTKYSVSVNYGVGNTTALKATKQTTKSFKLSWKAAQKASGYEIQKKVGKKWKDVATTTNRSYTVKKLTAGTVYTVRVRAYRNAKTGKVYSSWRTLKTTTKPTKVKIKKPSTNSKHQIIVKWEKVKKCSGYQVQFAKNKSCKSVIATKTVKGRKKTSYTGKNFTKGNTYYVRVRAYKTLDGTKYYGSWSDVKSIKSK
ncbi:MAG: fibronectin type III domain-containing protein [Eubacterium sp.]|nr:fibronectin type III domain-containing protein [Eubacterium sp.]